MTATLILRSLEYDPAIFTWTIELSDHDGKGINKTKVVDPFTEQQEEDLIWYFEKYPLDDPFARGTANLVVESLSSYKHTLAASIEPLLLEYLDLNVDARIETIAIAIYDVNDDQRAIQGLHWEVLEDRQSWTELTVPVHFFRYTKCNSPCSNSAISLPDSNSRKCYNILLVSARSTRNKDLSYRLISKPIWDLVQSHTRLKRKIKIYFIRPGTWEAFKTTLSDSALHPGFFDLVHFDTHGIVHKGKAKLAFSSPDPHGYVDKIDAESIAKVLSMYGVRTVVLNACNTAKVSETSALSNLARTFNIYGISNVVAMSFAIIAHSAQAFMAEFYEKHFLLGYDLKRSVASGRNKLREYQIKPGRFAVDVSVDDSCIPVLYQNHNSEIYWDLELISQQPDSELLRDLNIEDDDCTDQTSQYEETFERDSDLLSLEVHLSKRKAVNITGSPGIGKTTAVIHFAQWWVWSGFVQRAFRFNFQDDLWTDASIYKRIASQLSETPRDVDSCIQLVHNHRFLIIVDDFAPDTCRLLGIPRTLSNTEIQEISDFIQRFNQPSNQCMLILVSRAHQSLTEPLTLGRYFMDGISATSALNASRQMLAKCDSKLGLNSVWGQKMEDVIAVHRSNLLFLEIFAPVLADQDPHTLLYNLQLNLPDDCLMLMESHLAGRIERDGPAAPERMPRSDLLVAFKALCYNLRSQRPQCYWMLLSLAPFQQRIIRKPQLWLSRLHINGLSSIDHAGPRDEGIALWTQSAWDEFYSTNKDWLESFDYLLRVLSIFGLGEEVRPADPNYVTYFDIHPLLPYLTRHEIYSCSPTRDNGFMGKVKVAFWEFYEIIVSRYTTDGKVPVVGGTDALFQERVNISNALRLSTQRSQFGIHPMGLYSALHWMTFHKTILGEMRSGSRILTDIFENFELWLLSQQSIQGSTNQSVRCLIFEQALLVALHRMRLFYWTRDITLVTNSVRRAQALLNTFSQIQTPSGNAKALMYAIGAMAVAFQRIPIVTKIERLGELLKYPLPAGTTEPVKSLVFDATKVALCGTYIMGQLLAKEPKSHSEMIATISQAQGSLDGLQRLLAKGDCLTHNITDFIGSIADISSRTLSKNESDKPDISDSLTSLLTTMAAVVPDDGQYTADMAIIKSMISNNFAPTVNERYRLQQAVGSGHTRHRAAQQASGEEALFLLAVQKLDYETATLHHGRLLQLQLQNPTLGFSAVTLQNAEGIRNFQMGTMLIAQAKTESNKRDGVYLARAYQAKEHLDGARILLLGDVVSRAELYDTLLALAEWEKTYGGHAGVGVAYILQAASLKYLVEAPFSRVPTENGAPIEQMCCEWLCSSEPGDFETQLAQTMRQVVSQQPPGMRMSDFLSDPARVQSLLEQCAAFVPDNLHSEPESVTDPILEEAQVLALAPESARRKLKFWRMDMFGEWKINWTALTAKNTTDSTLEPNDAIASDGDTDILHMDSLNPPTQTWIYGNSNAYDFKAAYNQAESLLKEGKAAEAEPLYLKALWKMKPIFGTDHIATLVAETRLGVALKLQDKNHEAERVHRLVFQKRVRILGTEHLDTLLSMNFLVVALLDQGKVVEAEQLCRQVVHGRKKILVIQHAASLQSMSNHATLLGRLKENAKAEDIHRQILEGRKILLGEEAEPTLLTMNNLATVLLAQQKNGEAEKLYRQTLVARKKVSGEKHKETLMATFNLGVVIRLRDPVSKEAEGLFRESLDRREEVLGKTHLHTLASANYLGVVLFNQGRNAEAETYFRLAFAGTRDQGGDTSTVVNNLKSALILQGKVMEAEEL